MTSNNALENSLNHLSVLKSKDKSCTLQVSLPSANNHHHIKRLVLNITGRMLAYASQSFFTCM